MSTPASDPTLQPVNPDEVSQALARAIQNCAENAGAATDGGQAKDFGNGAFQLAQAWRALNEPLVPPQPTTRPPAKES